MTVEVSTEYLVAFALGSCLSVLRSLVVTVCGSSRSQVMQPILCLRLAESADFMTSLQCLRCGPDSLICCEACSRICLLDAF